MAFSDQMITMEDGRTIVRRVVLRPASPPSSPENSVSSSRSTPSPPRRQPLIPKEPAKPGTRCAEVAGGTAAECAAVCCCCPCGLVNLAVLVLVKLPAGLCRRAMRKRRKKKRSKGGSGEMSSKKVGLLASDKDGSEGGMSRSSKRMTVAAEGWPAKAPSMEEKNMEKEMWEKFYSAGFWRSPSQRE